MLHSPASSTSSSAGLSSSGEKHSPSAHSDLSGPDRTGTGTGTGGGENTSWHSGRSSPGKRSLEEETDEDEDIDVTVNNNNNKNNNNNNNKRLASEELLISCRSSSPAHPGSPIIVRPRSTDSQHSGKSSPGGAPSMSPPFSNGHGAGAGSMATSGSSEHLKLDRNQNVPSSGGSGDLSDDENNLSAFRKVEKRGADLSPPVPGAHPSSYSDPAGYKLSSSTLYSPTPINGTGLKASVGGGQPEKTYGPPAGSTMPHPSFLPRLALLPGNAPGMPPSFLQGGGRYNENLPLSMSNLYRTSKFNPGNADMSRPSPMTTDKLADIHNIENNGMHAKMAAFLPASSPTAAVAAAAMSMRMSPYYKSQNPMVEKLLTTPAVPRVAPFSLNLTQNWCAKCNATFRMTSDLVYHMRSHHKEAPMIKKKREDKLKCTVCGETFRERHHLTRHMTSHQWWRHDPQLSWFKLVTFKPTRNFNLTLLTPELVLTKEEQLTWSRGSISLTIYRICHGVTSLPSGQEVNPKQ